MVDFTPVLTRAVTGKASYDERRVVYDKARQALLGQLRGLVPPLPEADITKQRLALEEAIRQVEMSASGLTPSKPAVPEPARPAPLPVAPVKVPPAPVEPVREVVKPSQPLAKPPVVAALVVPVENEVPLPPLAPEEAEEEENDGIIRPRLLPVSDDVELGRDYKKWVMGGLIALFLVIFAGGAFLFWPKSLSPTASGGGAAPAGGSKIADRMQQEGSDAAPNAPTAVVNQAAFLYEENVDTSKGTDAFRGKVTWRLDVDSNRQGAGPEKVIQGLVEIPERGLKMLLTIRRNTDTALPASHTVELLFDVAADFVHGSVESVAGIRMKPSDQANGLPLVGASARITAGYFLIGLSAVGADRERNVVLLRDRPWIDVPVLYRNGRRAVIALEKGIPGEKVFQEAFTNWGG